MGVARKQHEVMLDGQGRVVTRAFTVDAHPWYESAEQSLQSHALTGFRAPLLFWMIEPYGGNAYLMAARVDRREAVEVDGISREGVRLVVQPAGLLAFLWKSTYWYDPSDGTFLRSKSLRGLFARFPTLIELVEDRRP